MENQYKDDSSSSFTADLFGSKQPTQPSSSTGFFASIFPPPKVVGSNSSCSELPEHMQKQSSGNYHAWSTKQGTTEVIEKTEGESNIMTHKERKIFQERAEPCPLSSSLYYGGPEDMYIHSSSTPSLDSFPIFKKDAVEGDPNGSYLHSASRGNWWQGSLYY
ncbi:Endochitinase [Actinidia chinensis var. chinensis]|uniref:Endochitinase n=1 Tax=Actinidia chinensis var. chinensis TaxID=1590841 RepID=A0A2R6QSY8_ACTCC|nr:Endochitinase [Actinidia chinensis var. chinensis]